MRQSVGIVLSTVSKSQCWPVSGWCINRNVHDLKAIVMNYIIRVEKGVMGLIFVIMQALVLLASNWKVNQGIYNYCQNLII